MPLIWRNKIDSSGLDGIFVYGPICDPDIRGNIITSNRKAGIKFTNFAKGHIGGTSREEINVLPSMSDKAEL